MAQTVRLEVHRERLIANLKATADKRRAEYDMTFASADDEKNHRYEVQADEMSAILSCIRFVIE